LHRMLMLSTRSQQIGTGSLKVAAAMFPSEL
jgi:hypothetical protein